MKKLIIKAVVFSIILLGMILYLNSFFSKGSIFKKTMDSFSNLKKNNKQVDIAIYGSSHAYCSFNPLILDKHSKARSFNFSNVAQRLAVTKYVIKETLKISDPDLLVVDIYPSTIRNPSSDEILGFQYSNYDQFPISLSKIRSVFEVFPSANSHRIKVLFPFTRRNEFIPKMKFKRHRWPSSARVSEYRGFIGFDSFLKEEEERKYEYYLNKRKHLNRLEDNFSKKEINNIIDVVKLAKSNQKKLLFVISPYLTSFVDKRYISFKNRIDSICNEYNVKLIDFNLLYRETGIGLMDFRDSKHLNIAGAEKASKYLGKFIIDNYNIKSRENDPLWKQDQVVGSIEDYIKSDIYKNSIVEVNHEFKDDLKIEEIGIYPSPSRRQITFLIKPTQEIDPDILKRYKLGFHTQIYDKDKDLLKPYSKSKGRTYDAWDFEPSIVKIGDELFIKHTINTRIRKFKKLRIFLYDRSGYTKMIGEEIEIEKIHIIDPLKIL